MKTFPLLDVNVRRQRKKVTKLGENKLPMIDFDTVMYKLDSMLEH